MNLKNPMTVGLTAATWAIAALLGAAGEARAGTFVDMKLMSWSSHANSGPTVNLYNTLNQKIASDLVRDGGAFLWKGLGASGPSPSLADFVDPFPNNNQTDFLTFCLELNQNIGWNGVYHAEVISLDQAPNTGAPPGPNPTGMGADSARWIEQLWATYFPLLTPVSPTAIGSDLAAAFQLAIWKLEYDPELMAGGLTMAEFQSGYLRIPQADVGTYSNGSNKIIDLAYQWINNVLTNTGTLPRARLVALTGSFQDQVVELQGGNIVQQTPVPEPASMAVWLVVGAALAFPRLRRRQSKSTDVVA